MFGELRLVRALSDEQIEAMRDPRLVPNVKLPRIEDAVKAGGFLTGTPDDIIEQLKALEKRYPGLQPRHCRPTSGLAAVTMSGTVGMVREGRHAGVRTA